MCLVNNVYRAVQYVLKLISLMLTMYVNSF
jgi:hypothetical protein